MRKEKKKEKRKTIPPPSVAHRRRNPPFLLLTSPACVHAWLALSRPGCTAIARPTLTTPCLVSRWIQRRRRLFFSFSLAVSAAALDDMLRTNNVKFGVNVDVTTYTDGVRETHNIPGRAHPGTCPTPPSLDPRPQTSLYTLTSCAGSASGFFSQ